MMWRSSKIGLPTPSKAGIGILLLSSGEASGMPVATGSMPVVIGRADQGLRPNMCCHDVFVRYDITNGSAMPLQKASDPLVESWRGCRWTLCRPGFSAERLPLALRERHHALASGCVFVRSCPTREAGKKGRPAFKGKPQPKLTERLQDPKHSLAEIHAVLVWRNNARDGDRHGHGSVVSISHPSCGDPLDAHSRSTGPIRANGLALYRSTGRSSPDGGMVCLALDGGSHFS